MLDPDTYVSIKSISCILLSSFELDAILLISLVETLSLSNLNLCCVFVISLFFVNSFLSSLRQAKSISFFSKWFAVFSIWDALKHFLFFKFKFSFYDTYFVPFVFYIHHKYLLNNYMLFSLNQTNFFMIFPPNSSFINPTTCLFFP